MQLDMILTVLFAAVVGFIGGVLGSIYSDVYLNPPSVSSTAVVSQPVVRLGSDGAALDLEKAVGSAVAFYPAKGAAQAGWQPDPATAIGGGAVLTSGGWLLTVDPSGKLAKQAVVAVIDGRAYAVGEIIRDDHAGVAFVRVGGAEGLSAAWITGDTEYVPGSQLYAFGARRETLKADVLGVADIEAAGGVLSSETVQKVVRLGLAGDIPVGSMLVDRRGIAVAVFAGRDARGWYAVPMAAFYGRMDEVFRDKAIARPYLGIHYVDLASTVIPVGGSGRSRGALIPEAADGQRPIAIGSPAATAGLRIGDVVVAVDDEELTAQRGLADVLADYRPGAEVVLTVEHGDQPGPDGRWPTIQLKVVLGERP